MTEKIKLNEKGLESFPKSTAIFGNLLMIIWVIVGAVTIWFFNPYIAIMYFLLVTFMIYIVLRKLICTNCYYYDRWCGLGWGKLAARLFKKGDMEDFNESTGLKLAPLVYGILMFVPLILLIILLIQDFDVAKFGLLILVILMSIYSGNISRKTACSKCKMMLFCKGSAVKSATDLP